MKSKRMMLGLVIAIAIAGFTSTSHAWYPTGWVYGNLPYYYSNNDATWYYFNDDVYVADMSTGQWSTFRAKLNNGWLWFTWPYVYHQWQGKWYYINQGQYPWVCNMRTSTWSVFGKLGTGDVQVTLRWDKTSDLDLYVKDPSGELIYFDHKTSVSGGRLDVDDTDGYGPENIFWAAGTAPRGTYTVYVEYWTGALPVSYNVNINGMTQYFSFPAGTAEKYRKQVGTFTR